jgi:hypothetical protein
LARLVLAGFLARGESAPVLKGFWSGPKSALQTIRRVADLADRRAMPIASGGSNLRGLHARSHQSYCFRQRQAGGKWSRSAHLT